MSTRDDPPGPRTLDCTALVEMPVGLLRERVLEHLKANAAGSDSLARIFLKLSWVLMSMHQDPERMQRVVAFLEFAEWLDGLGSSPGKRAA